MVSQNPVLFSGSLRYNIGYGLKGCTIEKVKEAAKKANADAFISELDDGYDTGTQVSHTERVQIDYYSWTLIVLK